MKVQSILAIVVLAQLLAAFHASSLPAVEELPTLQALSPVAEASPAPAAVGQRVGNSVTGALTTASNVVGNATGAMQ